MALVIALIVVGLFIVVMAVGITFFIKMMCRPNVHTHQEGMEAMKACGFDCAEFENTHPHEEFSFKSPRGYTLKGLIYRNENETGNENGHEAGDEAKGARQKAVILVHGYTGSYSTMYPYAKMMYDLGFNVIVYDHRGHGYSDKGKDQFCSMGYFESMDLIDLFYYIKPRFKDDCIWGILGESMGAGTVMQTAWQIKELSFAIEDCGYSCMIKQAKSIMNSKHVPAFPMLYLGNLIIKMHFKFSLYDINAIEAMKKTDIPMLFCHGDADTFVPTQMVYEVYNAKKDKKTLQLYAGSPHARSLLEHTEQYYQVVEDFLKKNVLV